MPTRPNEIRITRVYDAPVKLVWDAWTDLDQVQQWWGPRGFTLTTRSKDLRPGGRWIYTMHGPDGTDYPNIATYHEVVPYEKLVYDHGANEEHDKLFTVTATFREEKGKTTLDMTFALSTPEEARATKEFIKKANGNSTWDRLGEFLEDKTKGKDIFIISRSFAAEINTVFDCWVDPRRFEQWLGPVGSVMSFLGADVREGGNAQWKMTTGDGQTMYGRMYFRTIARPHLLIYTQHFCDEKGNLCKAPFLPTYPDEILTTVTFAEEGADQSRVTLEWEIAGDATEVERETFRGMKSSMTGGWNGSFDKLDTLLKSRE